MSDVNKVNPFVSKDGTEERTRTENQMLANASFSWVPDFVDDQMSSDSDQSMTEDSSEASEDSSETSEVSSEASEVSSEASEDSDEAKYKHKPSNSKKFKSNKFRGGSGWRMSKITVANSDEGGVQDQIILAPEIMCLILEQLDFRSMKQVRLVCKSWLLEAQTHMRRRAIVRFEREGCTARINSFLKTFRSKLPTLPNPFESIDLDLYTYIKNLGHKGLISKFGSLRPPLVITRFNPAAVPMKVALPLILQWSSSLEYLKLVAVSCEADYLPPMDPEQNFPKLRHVHAEIPIVLTDGFPCSVVNTGADWKHFPRIVAWIVNASPTLEVFESTNASELELAYQLSLSIDLKNVKSLKLKHSRYNTPALEHFLSTPFGRLENLKFACKYDSPPWVHEAVAAAVRNSAHTLKTLSLYQENQRLVKWFPLCPNVHELSLPSFSFLKAFISDPFPSLQVLKIFKFEVDVSRSLWRKLPPFVGLKTLRVESCNLLMRPGCDRDELPIKFFEKFPSLESLQLDPEFLLRCCQLKATGESRFSDMLASVRHLELYETYRSREVLDYSLLRFLKGVETITLMKSSDKATLIPCEEMPSLKVLKFPFPFGDSRDFYRYYELRDVAWKVGKVVITNCGSIRRGKHESSKCLLNEYFESARNAECGCGSC